MNSNEKNSDEYVFNDDMADNNINDYLLTEDINAEPDDLMADPLVSASADKINYDLQKILEENNQPTNEQHNNASPDKPTTDQSKRKRPLPKSLLANQQ